MTPKDKARHLGRGAGREKHPDAQDYTPSDPLIGWYSLAKQNRMARQPRRGWERRSR
jgi:hypothetical protein